MRSYVKPAVVTKGQSSHSREEQTPPNAPLLTIWFSFPYRLEKENKHKALLRRKKRREGDRVGAGECVCILDGGIENLGREVICGYIATYSYGIAAGSLDFVYDSLRLLFVEATFVSAMHGGHQHHSFTCKRWGGALTR
jgi:hypothetical protein